LSPKAGEAAAEPCGSTSLIGIGRVAQAIAQEIERQHRHQLNIFIRDDS